MSSEKDLAVQMLHMQKDLLLEHGVDVAKRAIQLVGEINEEAFCKLDSELSLLEQQSRKGITIKIVSHGGHVYSAMAIVSRIRASSCKITTEGYGYMMSAASLILASGHKRRMSEESVFMHHEGSASFEGELSVVEHQMKQMKRENKLWAQTMEKLTGVAKDFWLENGVGGKDLYLDAGQCLELGIVDEIF